jgi:4-amino-4-deoxy-L-arabinose transferase-like glycosyltransferase
LNTTTNPTTRRWRPISLALIVSAWAILQIGGLFTPGLLDDVDSVYIQIAREMLQRHDFVTPTIDGIRFFDKPPLMYWMAAGSMHLFGVHDWAARLPLALGVLALLLAVYALGIRFYSAISPTTHPDRGGLYASLAMATCLGPYLYTRFYIPDILIALWMTLSVHLFLIALDRIAPFHPTNTVILSEARSAKPKDPDDLSPATAPQSVSTKKRSPSAQDSALLPCLAFAAVTALNLLTKGLIGVLFPLGFVLLYLAFTHRLKLLAKFHLVSSTAVFLAIAAPWHILAALRNPPIPMPANLGLPARAGWAWFYLYNEHIARFLGRRIPHDYGQVPIPLFWLLLALWLLPWVAFLPAALIEAIRELRPAKPDAALRFDSDTDFSHQPAEIASTRFKRAHAYVWGNDPKDHRREAALACLLWAGLILGFFTLSSRQEYYHLPALPALALLVAGLLAAADAQFSSAHNHSPYSALPLRINPTKQALRGALFFLVPFGTLLFLLCGYFALTAPAPHPGLTLSDALSSNPYFYNLSLGHIFDLTSQAMGFFKGPLLTVALSMLTLGPITYLVRRRNPFAANFLIAASMTAVLLAAHVGLVRFYPTLGSKDLALAINAQLQPDDLLIIDGELTSGSTLLFYTPQRPHPVLLVNGRINGPWFGSFYPDAPNIFPTNTNLHQLWSGPHRVFLLTYHPEARTADLTPYAPVHTFATSGDKTILTNR